MGQHIVITGVSRGLGRALTTALIAQGHRVSGCARSPAAITELSQAYPPPHRFAALDIGDDQAVKTWAASVLETDGEPDRVINNAGLVNRPAPLWQVPAAECQAVIDVNLMGTINVLRHFVPAMIARSYGIIVNFSSGWGRSTSPGVAPYCATKWAIEGLTQALAQELPPGLAAVTLNPGIIHTDMLEVCYGEGAAAYTSISAWVTVAAPFIMAIEPTDNGQALTVPTP
ncbi:MAG TPA: SDR family NAD(P)-dependent oxidoreductase [Leptolyngbyaceae cyanobacterium M65_K2018_010]|nr:SDR family NAD(P)-dependent oxidoreductase [Leptolyngbyaceae cyanobacterium M65_K2018_010]